MQKHNLDDSNEFLYTASPPAFVGLMLSTRYYSSKKDSRPAVLSSRYHKDQARQSNRTSNFSIGTHPISQPTVEAQNRNRPSKSPTNHLDLKAMKTQSIAEMFLSRKPGEYRVNLHNSKSPKRDLRINQPATSRNKQSLSLNMGYNTANMLSSRMKELKHVRNTHNVVPMQKIGEPVDSTEFANFGPTPSRRNQQEQLFKPRRNKNYKHNIQAGYLDQKLKRMNTKMDEKDDIVDKNTKDTRVDKKIKGVLTQPNQQYPKMQYFRKLKFKTYMFDLKNYTYVRQLGKGGYARVILCRHDIQSTHYAVKIYDKLQLQSKSKISNIQRQLTIMKTIANHSCISSYKQHFENKTTVFIVMEYCVGTSLFSQIKTSFIQRIPQARAKKLFTQIITAVQYMKQKNIAHRDIKAQNILIDKQSVKLIDFGFSIFVEQRQLIQTFCGTPTYMAPEIVAREPYNPYKSDVWSLGVLLYLMLHGVYPFFSTEEDVLFKKIQKGSYKVSGNVSQEAKEVIRAMMMVDPLERVRIEDILRLEWFRMG